MATITVRNIPTEIVEKLKKLAKTNNRSMEAEARETLADHVARTPALQTMSPEERLEMLHRLDEMRKRAPRLPGDPGILADIRAERGER